MQNFHMIPRVCVGFIAVIENGPFLCVYCRSYSVPGEAQVHENPEWEKARQALASINKNQSPDKTEQVNLNAAQVLSHFQL